MKNNKFLKTMTAMLSVIAVCAMIMTGCGSGKKEAAQEDTQSPAQTDKTQERAVDTSAMHHAQIKIRDYGTITIALDEEAAPATVENFTKLVNEGFYDGLTFHRIIDGFMIQGGDPAGNGTGGSDETIVGEFASNGHDNPISHVKGVISMARAQNPDSASSQFFITVADSTFLDGDYAAFGYVTEGMDIADQIAREAEPVDNNGTIPPEAQPVIESITMIDYGLKRPGCRGCLGIQQKSIYKEAS